MNNKIERKCPRCNIVSFFKNPLYVSTLSPEELTRCKHCKPINDEFVDQLKRGIFCRRCTECNGVVKHKCRVAMLHAQRNNSPCITCSNRRTCKSLRANTIETIKNWSHITGLEKVRYKRFVKIRNHWSTFTEEQKANFIQKTPQQKIDYWGHLNRKNNNTRKVNLRNAFVKYRGENHWMKRPEVYAKVKKTCEKYKGDNHWFRRPKVIVDNNKITC